MARTRVLVVHSNLDVLSRVYLSLVHRNFKAEACNRPEEFPERLKRVKPAVVIIDLSTWESFHQKIKSPVIILLEKGQVADIPRDPEIIVLQEPVTMDNLLQKLQEVVI